MMNNVDQMTLVDHFATIIFQNRFSTLIEYLYESLFVDRNDCDMT